MEHRSRRTRTLASTIGDLALIALGGLMVLLPLPVLVDATGVDPLKVLLLGGLVVPPALFLLLVQRRRGPDGLSVSIPRADRRR